MILHDYQTDIDDISAIPGIDTLLKMVCRTTGMGFAAVARVTDDRWITCRVHDTINFGLRPGDELSLETTICNEIRQTGKGVVIDSVINDIKYKNHRTPALYGFESYISMPIYRLDGSFFGTLCAVDPEPRRISTVEVEELFRLFTNLISAYLGNAQNLKLKDDTINANSLINGRLEAMVAHRTAQLRDKNRQLLKANKDLESFVYIASHDLQEPLRKIQLIASSIAAREIQNLSEQGRDYLARMQNAAERMQTLIQDLLQYSRTSLSETPFVMVNMGTIIQNVLQIMDDEILSANARIVVNSHCNARVIPFQVEQLLINLIGNALKFSRRDVNPQIKISCCIVPNTNPQWHTANVVELSVTDNGIGFDQKFESHIFEIFQQLHNKDKYTGTGMGLAIVKKIAENHNGTISASGKLNKGATFTLQIPQ